MARRINEQRADQNGNERAEEAEGQHGAYVFEERLFLHVVAAFEDDWRQQQYHKQIIEMLRDVFRQEALVRELENDARENSYERRQARLLQVLVL